MVTSGTYVYIEKKEESPASLWYRRPHVPMRMSKGYLEPLVSSNITCTQAFLWEPPPLNLDSNLSLFLIIPLQFAI